MYSAWTMHSAQSDAIIAHQISSSDVLGLDDALGALTTREHRQQHLLRRRCFAQSDPRPRHCHVPRVGEVGAVLSTCMQCATSPRAIRARYGATYHRERASLCGGASALETARARSQSSVAD